MPGTSNTVPAPASTETKLFRDTNYCQFTGRLGSDPEVRYMPSGGSITASTLYVTEQWRSNGSGDINASVTRIPFVFFGPKGEEFAKAANKGDWVALSGKFSERTWTDGSDQKHSRLELKVFKAEVRKKKATPATDNAAATSNSTETMSDPDYPDTDDLT